MSAAVVALFPAATTIEPAPAAPPTGYAAHARSAATIRAYKSDIACWRRWCASAGVPPCPARPEDVRDYLEARITGTPRLSVASLVRRITAISAEHRRQGHRLDVGHPAIRDTMAGIRRVHGTAPKRARAATTPIVRLLVETCDDSLLGRRDRAILLLGLAGAFRRSELAALEVGDVEFEPEGLRVHVRRSKTDVNGAGAQVGIFATGSPTCPVAAVRGWLDAAGISGGRVFRSLDRHGGMRDRMKGEVVGTVIQRRATMAGIDPAGLSAHSLRSGMITTAASMGLGEDAIMRQSRHRSVSVVRGYVRHGSLFHSTNVSGGIGL